MLKKWLVVIAALGWFLAAAASLVEFDRWKDVSEGRAAASPDGIRFSGFPQAIGTAAWEDLALVPPFKIEFRVRRLVVPEGEHNFGLTLILADGTEVLIYYNRIGMAFYIREAGEIVIHEGLGDPLPFPLGEFSSVTLLVGSDAVEVNVDGVYQGAFECRIPAIAGLRFHSYLVDTELASLSVTELESAAEPSPARETALAGGFDGSPGLSGPAGRELAPSRVENLRYTDGIEGQAVLLGDDSCLEYTLPEALARQGTASFWLRPDWDGAIDDPDDFPIYAFLTGRDAAGADRLKLFMWHYLRCDFARLEGEDDTELRNLCRGSFRRGDWMHVALVWRDGGLSRIYLNGRPYWGGKASAHRINRMAVGEVVRLCLGVPEAGTGRKNINAAVDRFRLERTALETPEIEAEYRRFMPWDAVNLRAVLPAGIPGEAGIRIEPGEGWETPAAEVTLRLVSQEGEIASGVFDWAADRSGELSLMLPALPAGPYTLRAEFTAGDIRIGRTFDLTVYETEAAAPESAEAVRLGEAVWSRRLDTLDGVVSAGETRLVQSALGDYVQGGADKADRFAFEFTVPPECLNGEPVMLEISWPDDRPRSMGFYVYPESQIRHHRDRLEGGVQSGDEFPLTNAVQTSRYLFYPQRERNLFEVRSLVEGMPAALSAFAVRPLAGRLPRLAVNRPAGLPGRELGSLDEDQSFDILMEFDDPAARNSRERTARIMRRVLDYFDYTGQTLMSYPVLRYDFHFYPAEGGVTHGGLFPYGEGEMAQVIDQLHRRGKRFFATVNLFSLPEVMRDPDLVKPFADAGIILKDRGGRSMRSFSSYYRINPLHPEGRRLALGHIRRLLDAYAGIEGFAGVDLWAQGLFGCFQSLDEGYDDYTVGEFTRRTGIAVPEEGPRERQAFLTSPERIGAWLDFRAAGVTEYYRAVRGLLDRYDPGLEMIVSLDGVPTIGSSRETFADAAGAAEWFRREYGLDLAALRALPNTRIQPLRHPTSYRWNRHWGNPMNNANDYLYHPDSAALSGMGGSSGAFYTYFESFNDSLLPEVYRSYFQNADPKPFGRYFLKEYALPLAYGDVVRIQGGGQPFASAGRDEELREFARAYCALPALPFETAPGPGDPVTVRYRPTAGGTYWYAVNLLPFEQEVRIGFREAGSSTDLSDGAVQPQGTSLTLTLKPFELRSFLMPDQNNAVTAVEPAASGEAVAYYRERLEPVAAAIERLRQRGLLDQRLAGEAEKLREAFAAGRYAETDRLLFGKPLQEMLVRAENLENIAEQAAMRRAGRYALNAGGTGFLRSGDGTLFAPDAPYSGETGMGFVGSRLTTRRNPSPEIPDAELYRSEAYEIERYQFDVPDGVYTVRLYVKVGFEPAAKPGVFVFDLLIEGRSVLENFDVFAAHGNDFSRGAVLEFSDVAVSDGRLEIDFVNDDEPSAKLCNAIEVIPQNPEGPVFEDPVFIPPEERAAAAGGPDVYRILFVGNSITRHGVAESLGWLREAGMAASDESCDYVHLTARKIQAALPERRVVIDFANVNECLAGQPPSPEPVPDLVVIQTGEHEGDRLSRQEVEDIYEERLIRPFAGLTPRPQIIGTGNWYPTDGQPYTGWVKEINDAYRAVCARHGAGFAPVEAYAADPQCRGYGEHPGVQWHPNDRGMAGYAEAIFAAWRELNGEGG